MTNNIGYGVVYTPDSLSEYVAALLLEEFNKDIPTDRLLCLFRTNSAHRTHFVFTRDRGRHFLFFFSFALPCRVASVVVFSHTG